MGTSLDSKKKAKKQRVSKHKLLKGFRQTQNVTFSAILEHLEFNYGGRQYVSVFHGPSSLKSISPALK